MSTGVGEGWANTQAPRKCCSCGGFCGVSKPQSGQGQQAAGQRHPQEGESFVLTTTLTWRGLEGFVCKTQWDTKKCCEFLRETVNKRGREGAAGQHSWPRGLGAREDWGARPLSGVGVDVPCGRRGEVSTAHPLTTCSLEERVSV